MRKLRSSGETGSPKSALVRKGSLRSLPRLRHDSPKMRRFSSGDMSPTFPGMMMTQATVPAAGGGAAFYDLTRFAEADEVHVDHPSLTGPNGETLKYCNGYQKGACREGLNKSATGPLRSVLGKCGAIHLKVSQEQLKHAKRWHNKLSPYVVSTCRIPQTTEEQLEASAAGMHVLLNRTPRLETPRPNPHFSPPPRLPAPNYICRQCEPSPKPLQPCAPRFVHATRALLIQVFPRSRSGQILCVFDRDMIQ
jgi:hypothetical protein